MPYLETTRSGSASCNLSLGWQIRVYPATLIPLVRPFAWVNGYIGGANSHTGAFSTWTWSWWSEPQGRTWHYEVRLDITSDDGYGHTASTRKIVASGVGGLADQYFDLSGTLTGSWSCSVGTDVLWDVNQAGYTTLSAPTVFPPATSYDWYEMSRYGVNPSCSITIGGTTVTATGPYTTGPRHRMTYLFGSYFDAICEDTASVSASLTSILVNSQTVGGATHSHVYLGQTANNWAVSLTAASQETNTITLSSVARIPAVCDVQAKIYNWDESYPDSLTMRVTGFDRETIGYRDITGTGIIGGSDTFYFYNFTSHIVVVTLTTTNTSDLTTALDGIPTSVSAAITAGSLVAVGDDSLSTRVLLRGWRFNGANVAHSANRTISGTGNDRTYTPYQCLSGYRFLTIQLKTQSGTDVPAVIEITDSHSYTKRWEVTVPSTTYTTMRIDLCAPNYTSIGTLPTADGKDDPYPRENTTNTAYAGSESVDTAYWGVTYMQRLRVYSGAVDIGTTSIDRAVETFSSYVPSGRGHSVERITKAIVAEVGTTTTYYARRFWQQNTDQRTEEESDVWWQSTEGGGTGTTSWLVQLLTIDDFVAQINATDNTKLRHAGWTASSSTAYPGSSICTVTQPPLRNCFTNSQTGLATWLYGGGILVTPNATNGTDYSVGIDIAGYGGSSAITAQTLFDSINGNFPPDLYDPFDVHGGTDSGLYLRGGAIYRGRAHGITLTGSQQPDVGRMVTLIQVAGGTNRGNGISTTNGVFDTNQPYGFGGITHRADHTYGGSYTFNNWYTSKQHRVVMSLAPPVSGCLSAYMSNWFTGAYTTIESGTFNVIIHIQLSYNASSWDTINTGIRADCAVINWHTTSKEPILILVYVVGTTVYRRTSFTYGKSWSMATTIGNGNNLSACMSAYGNQYIFYRQTISGSNGLIKCVVLDSIGNVMMPEHTVIGTGVSANPTACYVRDSIIYLLYQDLSNNVIVKTSDNQGYTFS